jgi:hypothetical protein
MTDIQALNAIITQLGGTTAYKYNIQAYNAWSVLQGGTGAYTRDIDALNAIDVLNGGSGGHRYNINALNSIDVAAGGTGGHTRDISALTSLGTLLNPLPAWGLLPYFSIPNDIIVITAGVNRTLYGDALINVPIENDLSVTYSGYGTQSGNNLNLTPVVGDIGDHALTITFRQAGALIGTYIVTVKVIAAVPDAPYKLMIIGDSLVYLGHVNIATGIDNAISATISYIGGLGTTIKHEGVSGSSFATWAGASSRFYVSSELNIPAYLAANSLDTPDFFHVRLGVNDMFGHSDDDLTDVIMNAIIADAKILVDKCLSVNAGVKVIIGLPTICENTGAGWNTNYDESIYNQDKYIEIIHKFWAGLISYFEDYNDRVYISNEAIFLDRDEGYPKRVEYISTVYTRQHRVISN